MISARTAAGRRPDEADPGGWSRNLVLAVLGALVVAGAVLRFVTASPLWLDEALSVNLARLPVGDLPDALRHDGHPALYYVLLGRWVDVFGDSDAAVRALSGVASLAAVPLVWAATRLRFGDRVAAHALVLAATSPYLIHYGSESRMYALMTLVVAAGWWSLERARSRPSAGRLVVLAVVTALAVHTHYWLVWLVSTVGLAVLFEWRRGPPGRRAAAVRALVAMAVGASTLLLWLPVLIDQVLHTGTPWAERARPAEVVVETLQALGGGTRFEPELLGVVLVVAALLGTFVAADGGGGAGAGSAAIIPLDPRVPRVSAGLALVVALTLTVGGLAAIVTGSGFEARYAAVVVPLLIGLAARGTASLPSSTAAVALVVIAALGVAIGVDEGRRDRSQGKEVAEVIDDRAVEGDVVVFCPDQLGPATLRYLRYGGPTLTYPPGSDPAFVDWYDYRDRIEASDPASFAAEVDTLAGGQSIWLVLMTSYRGFEGRCESLSAALAEQRAREPAVAARTVFEPMILEHLGPRS